MMAYLQCKKWLCSKISWGLRGTYLINVLPHVHVDVQKPGHNRACIGIFHKDFSNISWFLRVTRFLVCMQRPRMFELMSCAFFFTSTILQPCVLYSHRAHLSSLPRVLVPPAPHVLPLPLLLIWRVQSAVLPPFFIPMFLQRVKTGASLRY